jgi:hypothetical protein
LALTPIHVRRALDTDTVMDVSQMDFEDESFDLVIDKGAQLWSD